MAVKLNLGQFKDALTVLPDGEHEAEIDFIDEHVSPKGNQVIDVEAHVVGGDYDMKPVYIHYAITPQSNFGIASFLNACGISQDAFTAENTLDLSTLHGKHIMVTTQTEEGQQWPKVTSVRGVPKAAPKQSRLNKK
jgi:hypothetical protein